MSDYACNFTLCAIMHIFSTQAISAPGWSTQCGITEDHTTENLWCFFIRPPYFNRCTQAVSLAKWKLRKNEKESRGKWKSFPACRAFFSLLSMISRKNENPEISERGCLGGGKTSPFMYLWAMRGKRIRNCLLIKIVSQSSIIFYFLSFLQS